MNPPSSQARLHGTSTPAEGMARRVESDEGQSSLDAFSGAPVEAPRTPTGSPLEQFEMPSLRHDARRVPAAPTVPHAYLDLRNLYPDAPVPAVHGAPVIHRASLASSEGIGQVMDWTAEGHITSLTSRRCLADAMRFARRWTTSHSSSKRHGREVAAAYGHAHSGSAPRHRGRPRRRRCGRDRPP